jgi:two-component system, sensor histidine kinase
MPDLEPLVLIVDDNDSNRFVKAQFVRRAGFSVIEAGTGRQALDLARRHPVDVVLLDINLPDISGIDVCQRLKADEELASVQVLQISATAITDDDRVRGLSGGADAYLVEAGNPDVMIATLRALMRVRRAERERSAALLHEREARQAAEDANRAKDDFLATLSHELRTPLNAILGWTTQLRNGSLKEEQQRRALEAIERSARHEWRLVNQLLDAASIRRGKLRLETGPIDLRSVAATAVELVRPDAASKSIAIEVEAEPVQTVGDAARLQQVITNLLNNAVQFTGESGRIRLVIRADHDSAIIRIDDTGIGIEPDFLPFVFDEFRQADLAKNAHGGLGLGLAISRHIVEMHGGSIRVHSDGLGRGASFTVQLPRAVPA